MAWEGLGGQGAQKGPEVNHSSVFHPMATRPSLYRCLLLSLCCSCAVHRCISYHGWFTTLRSATLCLVGLRICTRPAIMCLYFWSWSHQFPTSRRFFVQFYELRFRNFGPKSHQPPTIRLIRHLTHTYITNATSFIAMKANRLQERPGRG